MPMLTFLRTDVMSYVCYEFIQSNVLPTPLRQFMAVREGLLQLDLDCTTRAWVFMAMTAAHYGAQQADQDAAELALAGWH